MLKKIGYTVADLKKSDFPAESLRRWNQRRDYSVMDLLRHFTSAQLHEGGYHKQMLKAAETAMLARRCYNTPEVRQCREQKQRGITIATLGLVYPIRTLKLAGFAAWEMQAAGFNANRLKLEAGYAAEDFYDPTMNARQATWTTQMLAKAGYAREDAIKGLNAWMGPYDGQRWRQLREENSEWLKEATHSSKRGPWCSHCKKHADIEHLLTGKCENKAVKHLLTASFVKKPEIMEAIQALHQCVPTVEHPTAKETQRIGFEVGEGVTVYIREYCFEDEPSSHDGIPEASSFIEAIKKNCGMKERTQPTRPRLKNQKVPASSAHSECHSRRASRIQPRPWATTSSQNEDSEPS